MFSMAEDAGAEPAGLRGGGHPSTLALQQQSQPSCLEVQQLRLGSCSTPQL